MSGPKLGFFFVTWGGGDRGVWGYPPFRKFSIWRLRNAIFSACHEICLRKNYVEYENGKQLQVTIIKITESKENKSIHRLDVSSSTGPRGAAAPLAPPPPPPLATALMSFIPVTNVFCNALILKGEI